MLDVQWAFLSIFTASLANFILRIVVGRELGPTGLGVYTLAFTIYLFGMLFAAFGIGAAQTKYIAEFIDDHTTVRKYVSSGMTSSIITGTLTGIVFFFLAPYIAISFFKIPELVGLIQLIALCYPFIAIQKSVLGTLNGFRKMHLYALLNIIQNISTVGVSIVLVKVFGLGVQGAVIGLVAPTILIGILCPLLIRKHIGLDGSLWDIPALRATTVFGFYIVLSSSIGYLNNQINSILIGYYLNPTEVGIFAIAVLLSQTLVLIPSAIQTVTNPMMANLAGKGDLEGVRLIFLSTLKMGLLISAGSAALIAIFGPYVITLLFGEIFLMAYVPLLILLLGMVVGASFAAVGTTLSSIGQVHILFRISAVCVVLNIILNILLIPPFGIIGAAIATSVMGIANFLITIVIINRYLIIHNINES
jgi:stage V sporulation protein B